MIYSTNFTKFFGAEWVPNKILACLLYIFHANISLFLLHKIKANMHTILSSQLSSKSISASRTEVLNIVVF